MKYTSPTNLADLTLAADRAQAFLNVTLDDFERMPASSVEFRFAALDKITDFIYRLTGVRKTLAALRASFRRNTSGLRELNEMVRNLHKQMLGLQSMREDLPIQNALASTQNPASSLIQNPKSKIQNLPPSPIQNPKSKIQNALRPARFSRSWLPSTDELIPEPRLPQSAMESLGAPAALPASYSGAPAPSPAAPAPLNANPEILDSNDSPCTTVPESVSPSVSTEFIPSTLSISSTPSDPQIQNPKSKIQNIPDPLAALAARLPESITNPDFKLPRESNRAADYAPLLKLDIVSKVRSIPVLPLAASDLDARIDAQFAQLTDTCVTLRADMRETRPQRAFQSGSFYSHT